MTRLVLPIALTLLLAACSSQPSVTAEQAPADVRNADTNATTGQINKGGEIASSEDARRLTQPGSLLAQRSIYFDYDSFTISEQYRPIVEAHARFLVEKSQDKVLIQGSADDRGSREYNLALGQKRADAVKRAMLLLGGKEDQIESVSLGKEKPMCTEASEECYARNRRADIRHSLAQEL